MNSFQFQTVPNIISGLGSIQQLRELLTTRPYQHLLLVTDADMLQHQLHLPILEILEDLSLTYSIYSEVEADPGEQIVLNAVNFARQQKVDLVLGFGGGSSMDVAKIIAILSHPAQQQQLADLYGVNNAQTPRLPLILVPTTAGTGSEVTPISIVTTGETTKTGIVAPVLFADVAILDATFTEKLPRHISAATKLLNQNLSLVLEDGRNLEARQNMLVGSMLAGQAFANAPVGAVHALAYPLGGHFHISHGHSNALVLTEVLKFNLPQAKHHYAELICWLDPKSTGCTDGLSDLFVDHIQNHLDRSGLTLKLKALNVPEHSLDQLATDAMLQTRLLQNNPRELEWQQAREIYQAIYS